MALFSQSDFMRIFLSRTGIVRTLEHDLPWSAVSGKLICLIILQDLKKQKSRKASSEDELFPLVIS